MDREQVNQDHEVDGTITFVGWMVFPPNMGNPMRMTITAGPSGIKLVNESANKL